MSNPNPSPTDNNPPEAPPPSADPPASGGPATNPPLEQHQRSAIMPDISRLWVPFEGEPTADPSPSANPTEVSAAPSQPPTTSPSNAPAGPSGRATGSLQPPPASSQGTSAFLPYERPPRARALNIVPGEITFQLSVPRQSTSAAVASTSSAPAPPSQDAFMTTFKSTFQPWETGCKCSNPTTKPARHWKHSCPYNDEIEDLECEVCGQTVGRPDNLARHRSEACPGRRGSGDEEGEEE
ncbi:hypothetical protein FRC04_007590 [Tulasnella sp. 424]|nr:hypothetical protein FRC04_007590 [Tulasnella sp. 424]KAG8979023.1 hypothetical protein FRC05_009233 [Tulasnella sp. 425]